MSVVKRMSAFAGSMPRFLFLLVLLALFALSGCLGNQAQPQQPEPVSKRRPARDYDRDYPPSQPVVVEDSDSSGPPPGPGDY